jgi:hypothetical protein
VHNCAAKCGPGREGPRVEDDSGETRFLLYHAQGHPDDPSYILWLDGFLSRKCCNFASDQARIATADYAYHPVKVLPIGLLWSVSEQKTNQFECNAGDRIDEEVVQVTARCVRRITFLSMLSHPRQSIVHIREVDCFASPGSLTSLISTINTPIFGDWRSTANLQQSPQMTSWIWISRDLSGSTACSTNWAIEVPWFSVSFLHHFSDQLIITD